MTRVSTAKIGKYKIKNRLGEGGMGRIHEGAIAFPLGQTQACAIKVMRDRIMAGGTLAMFAREALIGRELSRHPHIVATRDFGQSPDGQLFAVFDLEGPDLADISDALSGRYPVIRRIAEHGLLALRHVHESGFLHCDVSPGNILLGLDGNAKLSDFGLARPDVQPPGRWADVPYCNFIGVMPSPEVRQGAYPTREADLYSLGAVLYDILAGHLCSDYPSTTLAPSAERRQEPLPDEVPADLAALVGKLLLTRPADRPTVDEALAIIRESGEAMADKHEIAELVEQWLDRAEGGARRAPTPVRLTAAARQHMELLYGPAEDLEDWDDEDDELVEPERPEPTEPDQPRASPAPKSFHWKPWLAAVAMVAFIVGAYSLNDRQGPKGLDNADATLTPTLDSATPLEAPAPTPGPSGVNAESAPSAADATSNPAAIPPSAPTDAKQPKKPAQARGQARTQRRAERVRVYKPRARTDWDFFPAKDSAE